MTGRHEVKMNTKEKSKRKNAQDKGNSERVV